LRALLPGMKDGCTANHWDNDVCLKSAGFHEPSNCEVLSALPARRLFAASCRCENVGPSQLLQRREQSESDFQAIADRVEIEALRGEFVEALMMRDHHPFASFFTQEGALDTTPLPGSPPANDEGRS
jgi:hypothetical protein